MGLQIDTGQPIFEAPTSFAAAASTALVAGEITTLTWTWRNDGAETAVAPHLLLELPDGLAFVPSSMSVDGEGWTAADPTRAPGQPLGDLAPGETHEVAVDVQHLGGDDALTASATLGYDYTTCDDLQGDGLVRITAPTVAIARVEASLGAIPAGPASPGQRITLSLSLANVGAAPTRDATLTLALPEGLDFVADSLVIDGAPRPGAALPPGPFALGAHDGAPGVLPAGGLVTVSYDAVVEPVDAPMTLTVIAAFDDSASVDGAPAPVTTTVAVTVCGDGLAGGLEACDDGAANSDLNPDRCRTDCTAPRCGDGVQDSGEACDPGEALDTSCAYGERSCEVCGGGCVWVPGATSWCGDGQIDPRAGEVCDDGAGNSDVAPDACRTTCLAPECGDGVQDSGEACDDGNDIDDDECSDLCQAQLCGNGRLDQGEACDDGPGASPPCAYGDAECQRCDERCQLIPDAARWCGDGKLDEGEGEACDDGNNLLELCRYGEVACTVCGPDCRPTAGTPTWCGDGSVDGVHGEVCDDGNTRDGDGCSSTCRPDVVVSGIDDGCAGAAGGAALPVAIALLLMAIPWARRRGYGPTFEERASSLSRRSQPTGSSAAQARRYKRRASSAFGVTPAPRS
ncbi:MAG: hypothetical protein CSA66_00470 [Proteobacteria bacterium]|nr:MAG: hypothetical protein CSA66_00470 [Pseudomonadota bacterium]